MSAKKRVAVIGAGHNALVCACYLAKAGHDVTVYERNSYVGGAVHTEVMWGDAAESASSPKADSEIGGSRTSRNASADGVHHKYLVDT